MFPCGPIPQIVSHQDMKIQNVKVIGFQAMPEY